MEKSIIHKESNSKPLVHAVIVDFFKAPQVVNNLKTLTAQYPPNRLTVSVVDNSVSRQNAELLQAIDGRRNVSLTINKTNRGYAAACNQGVKHSKAGYILLLNPDISWPDNQSLQMLVDVMESSPDIAICGPKQIDPDGHTADTMRAQPKILNLILRRISWVNYLFRLSTARFQQLPTPDYNRDQAVDWLQSSCLLVRRSFWEKVGGLDKRYFLFMADVDLCRKAWNLGYKVQYVAGSTVYADGIRASTGGITAIFTKVALRKHIYDAARYFITYRGQAWP